MTSRLIWIFNQRASQFSDDVTRSIGVMFNGFTRRVQHKKGIERHAGRSAVNASIVNAQIQLLERGTDQRKEMRTAASVNENLSGIRYAGVIRVFRQD
jgi:hypothetical protein